MCSRCPLITSFGHAPLVPVPEPLKPTLMKTPLLNALGNVSRTLDLTFFPSVLPLVLRRFLIAATLFSIALSARAQFVAYVDYSPGTNTGPYTLRFMGPVSSGFLSNAADGITTPVFVTFSTNGAVTFGATAAEPAPGTPAYGTFNGYVNFGTSSQAVIQVPSNVFQIYTFTNLN